MASYWSELCSHALVDLPLETLLNKLYAVGGILASHLRLPLFTFHHAVSPSLNPRQVCSFAVSAIVHCVALSRWRKWSEEERQEGWRHYGWFTGLCFIGSAAGALAFAARIAQLSQNYPSRRVQMQLSTPTAEQQLQVSQMRGLEIRFTAFHFVLFPVELGCVIVAKLLVLRRLHHFTLSNSAHQRAWLLAGRVFLAVVIVLNFIGFFANVASAAYFGEASAFSDLASKAWESNRTVAAADFMQAVSGKAADAIRVSSVQRFCEVSVLLMTIVAFLVVGAQSHRIFNAALQKLVTAQQRLDTAPGPASDKTSSLLSEASLQGRLLQRKILITFLLVFFTVLVRSVFTVMYGLALAWQDYANNCSPSPCDACKNVYSHILFWILFTPEFQQVSTIIASPLAQLVALWGMSGARVLEQMPLQRLQLDAARSKAATQRKDKLFAMGNSGSSLTKM